MRVEGTPLADVEALDPFEFVRTIAVARITMPRAMVRLSAGREAMDDAMQALCFMAGANSMFYGDVLLTTGNPRMEADQRLLQRLGMRIDAGTHNHSHAHQDLHAAPAHTHSHDCAHPGAHDAPACR